MKKILLALLVILSFPKTSMALGNYNLNAPLFIEEAVEGNYYIKGNTDNYLVVTVFDNESKKLGSAVSDKNGKFKLFTNRTLKFGETLKLELEDESKNKEIKEFTISYNDKSKVNRPAYIKGFPDKTFRPHNKVTRAEAVNMFAYLLNGSNNLGTSKITKYTDSNNNWYSEAINYLSSKNIIGGYPDGTFRPDSFITRKEFASMVYNFDSSIKNNTKVIDEEKWSNKVITGVSSKGYMKGYPDGNFGEDKELTRAEAVSIFNRVFNRKTNEKSLIDIENYRELITFRDIYPSDWFFYDVLDASNSHYVEYSTQGEVWQSLNNKH